MMDDPADEHVPPKGDRVAGKVAIVTGGGSVAEGIGNGRAAAVLLARHGAKVALMDRERAAAEATARMIEADGGVCLVTEGDVTEPADCEAAVARTLGPWERLDILAITSEPAASAARPRMWTWRNGTTGCVSI